MASQGQTLTLWFFPIEIRQQIFELSLPANIEFEWNGRRRILAYESPALLVALRGVKALYLEAVYVFYKQNMVYYSIDNYMDFRVQGGVDRVKNVRHLEIDLTYNFREYQLEGSSFFEDGTNKHSVVSRFLRFLVTRDTYSWTGIKIRKRKRDAIKEPCRIAAVQIETLYVNIFHARNGFYNAYLILREMVIMSKKLKRVVLQIDDRSIDVDDADYTIRWRYPSNFGEEFSNPHNLIIQASHIFGMQGTASWFQNIGIGGNFCYRRLPQWTWEAKEGEVLKINEHINPGCKKLHDGPCEAV